MIDANAIPKELRDATQWVYWRRKTRKGKVTKVPYNARTHAMASTTDSETWSSFGEAADAAETHGDGVGFVFNDDYIGVDLDHAVVDGQLQPWALEIMQNCPTYQEFSPSGAGVHLIFRGKLPGQGHNRRYPNGTGIEIYSAKRYFTFTGKHVPTSTTTIEDQPAFVLNLYRELTRTNGYGHHKGRSANADTLSRQPFDLDQRLEVALRDPVFSRLWHGDTSGNGDDHSAADLALCNKLVFYFGPDRETIDSLFRQSALIRDKWERADYRHWTIDKAIEGTRETCVPPKSGQGKGQGSSRSSASNETHEEDSPLATLDTNLSDAGNGEFIAALLGDRFRHDHARKRDLLFRGHRWCQDATDELMIMAKGAARRRYVLAAKVEDTAKRGKIAKWAIQSESKVKIDAALAMARCETPISDDGRDWDNRPMLLVVGNGVVDLTTGIRRDGVPDDRMVLYTPVQFDPEARPHRFEQFISEIFQGDLDLIDFVQRALGYSLTGQTIEQVLFILYGTGANGKSVFLSIIRAALGEYGYNMPFSTVELKARATIPNDVAALVDKRFVTASETNESARFNEARIKALTGCDPITARFMHSEFFTFRPVAKFWLSVNHKPQVSDDSYGFWRRVRLIPFTQQFKDDQADPNLEVKLREELPGILAWLVRGCLEWQRRGLKPPAVVLNATETYREESDPLGQFIAERCHLDGASTAPARELYRGYRSWAEEQGFRDREILTSQAFGRRVGDRFKKKHTRCGAVYEGLGLYV